MRLPKVAKLISDALPIFALLFFAPSDGRAIAHGQAASASDSHPLKLESCKPVSERTGVEGCWILKSSPLGKLTDGPVFWTLDRYPTQESARSAALKNSTVLEALGEVWLLTVGDKIGVPTAGSRVAEIGPIPVKAGEDYTAQYRESIMQPGAISRTHLHSGPEIFYTEGGETCLETPAGKEVGRKGANIIAPEGVPMELMATGSETRRGIVLVLHSTSKPHTTLVSDWASKGLCKVAPPGPAGLTRTDLQRHDLSIEGREAIQTRVEFAPGAVAPWHSHPGEELIYVPEGRLEFQMQGEKPVTLETGGVLFIPAGRVHRARNVSSTRGIELATYVVEGQAAACTCRG